MFLEESLDLNQTTLSGAIAIKETFSYKSAVVRTATQKEQVIPRVTEYQYSTNLNETILEGCQVNYLNTFFARTKGKLNAFRYPSLIDFSVTHEPYYPYSDDTDVYQQGVAIPDPLDSKAIYLAKKYSVAGVSTLKPIAKPREGTVSIYELGTLITPSIDYTTGRVLFTQSVTASDYTWSGEFDLPVRFDIDELPNFIELETGLDTEDLPEFYSAFLDPRPSIYKLSSLNIIEDFQGVGNSSINRPVRVTVTYKQGNGAPGTTYADVYAPIEAVYTTCDVQIVSPSEQRFTTNIRVLAHDGNGALISPSVFEANNNVAYVSGDPFYNSLCSIAHKETLEGSSNQLTIISYEIDPRP